MTLNRHMTKMWRIDVRSGFFGTSSSCSMLKPRGSRTRPGSVLAVAPARSSSHLSEEHVHAESVHAHFLTLFLKLAMPISASMLYIHSSRPQE